MISVQEHDFNVGVEYQALADNCQIGAVVTFIGKVRDFNDGADVSGMFLEYYPGMTERQLEKIVERARARWPLDQVRVIHRVGQLDLGDQIVFVGVTSAHRDAAFDAARFIMDYLKNEAPFWKKETTASGDRWVEARHSDQDALNKW